MRVWLIASAVMIAVWAGTSLLSAAAVYPWFLWPIGIWGAIELFSWMSKRDGRRPG